jgi:hypothetical protein
MLMTFDAPDSNGTCTRRERSITPIQALTLMNDPVFVEAAQAMGRAVMGAGLGSVEERIALAFERCLARRPERRELDRLTRLHGEHMRLLAGTPDAARAMAGMAAGGAGEADEAAPEAGVRDEIRGGLTATAALVAVCRVLINLDEFVTRE